MTKCEVSKFCVKEKHLHSKEVVCTSFVFFFFFLIEGIESLYFVYLRGIDNTFSNLEGLPIISLNESYKKKVGATACYRLYS